MFYYITVSYSEFFFENFEIVYSFDCPEEWIEIKEEIEESMTDSEDEPIPVQVRFEDGELSTSIKVECDM